MNEKDSLTSKEKENVIKKEKVKTFCPLPIGCKNEVCPKCGSDDLTGAIITETADYQDPNILCLNCGYWRD